jgi:hypothetical protein
MTEPRNPLEVVEEALAAAQEWHAAFPHSDCGTVTTFELQTSQNVYERVCDALALIGIVPLPLPDGTEAPDDD